MSLDHHSAEPFPELLALNKALEAAREQMDAPRLELARELARHTYQASERAGASEAAQAFLYIEEALAAMAGGEIPVTAEGWRQVDAAWRSAQSVYARESKRPAADPPGRGRVVSASRSALGPRLQKACAEQRVDVAQHASLADAVSDLRPADVLVVEWCNAAGSKDELARARATKPCPVVAIGSDDDFASRYAAAELGFEVYLSTREAPRQFAEVLGRLITPRLRRRVLLLGQPDELARVKRQLPGGAFDVVRCAAPDALLECLASLSADALIVGASAGAERSACVCRMLRAACRWQDLPILAVLADEAAWHDVFAAGADDVQRDAFDAALPFRLNALVERAERARARAGRDVLTGLMTRRAFVEAAEARIAEARRCRKYLSVCLLDIDHFKHVNDVHGHPAGDEVLATLGALFGSRFRAEDIHGRWGGEEFVVAFFDEWAESARQILSRVTTELSSRTFTGASKQQFSVTASAGIATYPVHGASLDELIAAADAKLYAAKAAGRNRIVV